MALAGAEAVSALRPRHWDALRISAARRTQARPDEACLSAAIQWIKDAQDATGCGGVAWGYRARVAIGSGDLVGWQPPYPETSGYIIETLIRFGERYNDSDAIERARRIAEWEVGIQLPDGGFQGGVIGATPVASSTFVTGQVLFGIVKAHQTFGGHRYLEAGRRAVDFLTSRLDSEGRFTAGFSHFCATGPKCYEVRTGWAMALAGRHFDIAEAWEGGRRTAAFALRCQKPNGWFAENDLEDHRVPLTHTIGYTLEGLYENAVLFNDARCFEAVRLTLVEIKRLIGPDGSLAGRWTEDWEPAVRWCCLTGSAQIACVCFRMHRHYPQHGFDELGASLLSFVASTQPLADRNPGIRGGVHGSYPFGGAYGQYCNLNWAAKFFSDAVMDLMDARG